MSEVILDSSAVLAYLRNEPGADTLAPLFRNAAISVVNLTEVLSRLIALGQPFTEAQQAVDALMMRHVVFDEAQAFAAAALLPLTRRLGLSLGDRACLALARAEGLAVLTSDRAWASLDVGVEIRMIR